MEFDLTDPECFATQDPHPVFKRLRAEDPIHWTTGRISRGFWSITRYEDVLTVYRDADKFSSQRKRFNGSFLPRAIAQMEASSRQIVSEIVDVVAPRGECDFVVDVAARLPMA